MDGPLDKMVREAQKVQEVVKIQTPDFSYLDLYGHVFRP